MSSSSKTTYKIKITYPKTVGIKDLYCKGINPLRCVVCQENPKKESQMVCDNQDCIIRYKNNGELE